MKLYESLSMIAYVEIKNNISHKLYSNIDVNRGIQKLKEHTNVQRTKC